MPAQLQQPPYRYLVGSHDGHISAGVVQPYDTREWPSQNRDWQQAALPPEPGVEQPVAVLKVTPTQSKLTTLLYSAAHGIPLWTPPP